MFFGTGVPTDFSVEFLGFEQEVLEEGEGVEEGVVGDGRVELQNALSVDGFVAPELRAFDQGEDDGVFLSNQGATDAIQRHDVRSGGAC